MTSDRGTRDERSSWRGQESTGTYVGRKARKRKAFACDCGARVELDRDETLPRGWRVELVREWRNGMRVFASWRYTCPECAESVSRSSGN